MTYGALAIALAILMSGQPQQQQQSVPDAPSSSTPDAPTPSGSSLNNLKNQVAPGKSTTADSTDDATPAVGQSTPAGQPVGDAAPEGQPSTPAGQAVGDVPPADDEGVQQGQPESPSKDDFRIRINVAQVLVPVAVRDAKHNLVPGLTFRDFRIYENGVRQRINVFEVDPRPMSVAFVIDQSLASDTMKKVNDSLGAVTGVFAPYDEIALFTYNKFVEEPTTFTAAQGARLPAVLARTKAEGRDPGPAYNEGPLALGPSLNGEQIDPNLTTQRGNSSNVGLVSREIHPLNDAILEAAKQLAMQAKGRRRILYVVSDGKESGSKASQREVVQFLLSHDISVYGTLVGEAATWGVGYLDKVHLPFLSPTNILPRYTVATGGSLEAEFSTNGIQRSFGEITASIRTQYLIGYISPESMLDGRRRSIDVRTPGRPGLDIIAKASYYPTAVQLH